MTELKQFISYLWGIETLNMQMLLSSKCRFISYLWGIETYNKNYYNKNYPCLYLTYEELKPDFVAKYTGRRVYVYILPMRNWNHSGQSMSTYSLLSFISYLWGIETILWLHNTHVAYFVYILPMRNWNFWHQPHLPGLPNGLYLTYEELKL